MRYSPQLLHYFNHTKHAGVLMGDAIWSNQAGSEEQGDLVKIYLEIQADKIVKARFQAYGSTVMIGCCEWLCEWLEHKTLAELKMLTVPMLQKTLHLSEKSLHAPILLLDLLRSFKS